MWKCSQYLIGIDIEIFGQPYHTSTSFSQVMRTFLTRDQHLHGPRNATMDQVMMYMLLKDKGVNQPKVLGACFDVMPNHAMLTQRLCTSSQGHL